MRLRTIACMSEQDCSGQGAWCVCRCRWTKRMESLPSCSLYAAGASQWSLPAPDRTHQPRSSAFGVPHSQPELWADAPMQSVEADRLVAVATTTLDGADCPHDPHVLGEA